MILLGVALLLGEGASYLTLSVLDRTGRLRYQPVQTRAVGERHREILDGLLAGRPAFLRIDRDLGWSPTPSFSDSARIINAQGFRLDREVATPPPAGKLRIATFGDSFTFGEDVPDAFSFQEQMVRLVPDLEVLNFGVPGYGLGQGLLRYRKEANKYGSRIVLIGFLSENILRNVNVFRPFYAPSTGTPMAKPRFVLDGQILRAIPNPLPEEAAYRSLLDEPTRILPKLGRHDHHYRHGLHPGLWDLFATARLTKLTLQVFAPDASILSDGLYVPDSDALRLTTAIFDTFYEEVERSGARPLIVMFPHRRDMARYLADGRLSYEPLLRHFRKKGYQFVDLKDAFEGADADALEDLIPTHYSSAGNRLVADLLVERLRELDWLRLPDGRPIRAHSHPDAQTQAAAAIRATRARASFQALGTAERRSVLEEVRHGYGLPRAQR